jgi:DNA-binding PadR family transcriptional regulator
MSARSNPPPRWQHGFLGLYALHLMSQEPIYLHQVITRIAERTQGGWRPSTGAVYPAVRSLVAQGLARQRVAKGRTRFEITPAGRRRLVQFRADRGRWRGRWSNTGRLLVDLLEPGQIAEHVAERLHADLLVLETVLSGQGPPIPPVDRSYLASRARDELERALARLGSAPRAATPTVTR